MTAADRPSPGGVGKARVAVAATFFVHGLLFASWTPHIPHVKAHLHVGDATLGTALLGAPAGSVTAMVVAGLLLPRLGSRTLVRICLTGYCLAGPLVGLAGSVGGLFAALFVWGAFQGTLDVSMNTQAITVEHAHGRPLMNGMHAAWGLGAFAGAGLGTLGVQAGLSLTDQLAVGGLLSLLVVGTLTLRMLPDPPHERRVREPGRSRWPRPSGLLLVLGAMAFASMLAEGASADWSAVYLRDSLGSGVAGLGYTAFTLAMVTVRLLGNQLLARASAHVLLPVLAGMAAVGFAAALLIGTAPAALVGFVLLGLGLGMVMPTAFSAAGRLPGRHPGVSVAIASGLGWAGFVCGPPLIGHLAGATSLPAALGVIPVLAAFIAVAAGRVPVLRTVRSAD